MDRGSTEIPRNKESIAANLKVIDIFDKDEKYQLHWTKDEKLPGILRKGLFSRKFAERVGEKDFPKGYRHEDRLVYLATLHSPTTIDLWTDPRTGVGIIVDAPYYRHGIARIRPSFFAGLLCLILKVLA